MDAEQLDPTGANGALASQGNGSGDVRQAARRKPARFRRRSGDPRDLPVRGLAEGGRSVDVVRIRSGVPDTETGCQAEQREGFHSLFWLRSGTGTQFIDGKPVRVGSPTLTLVGRGQVYRSEDMGDIDGAIIGFGDDLLHEGSAVASRHWNWDGASVDRAAVIPDVMMGAVQVLRLISRPHTLGAPRCAALRREHHPTRALHADGRSRAGAHLDLSAAVANPRSRLGRQGLRPGCLRRAVGEDARQPGRGGSTGCRGEHEGSVAGP